MQPLAFCMASVTAKANFLAEKDGDGNPKRESFAAWLADRKHRREIPHRFENCGYSSVLNRSNKQGLWIVNGARQMIYARTDLSERDRLAAAKWVVDTAGEVALDP
jgi:hypothetical protein